MMMMLHSVNSSTYSSSNLGVACSDHLYHENLKLSTSAKSPANLAEERNVVFEDSENKKSESGILLDLSSKPKEMRNFVPATNDDCLLQKQKGKKI